MAFGEITVTTQDGLLIAYRTDHKTNCVRFEIYCMPVDERGAFCAIQITDNGEDRECHRYCAEKDKENLEIWWDSISTVIAHHLLEVAEEQLLHMAAYNNRAGALN